MIRVYSTPDRRARCVTFADEAPPTPPLELVWAFPDDERESAWDLLGTSWLLSGSPEGLSGISDPFDREPLRTCGGARPC